jgi:hypothetical protein
MQQVHVHALRSQALDTERGGRHISHTALQCAINADLTHEWQAYLEQTETSAQVLRELCDTLQRDPLQETPGRQVVRHLWHARVSAMEMALSAGNPEAAQLIAAECGVLAATNDHLPWELRSAVAEGRKGKAGQAVQAAYEQVEDEEDAHLYHTTGWSRERWTASLGLPAVLPPPEEEKDVKTAIGAARAKNARKAMLQ